MIINDNFIEIGKYLPTWIALLIICGRKFTKIPRKFLVIIFSA